MKVWSNGLIIDGPKQIDSLNFSLHYSSPVAWEGIRSYVQADGTNKTFRLREHVARLFETAKILDFEIPYTQSEVIEACEEVVKANGGGDMYLRPIAYSNQEAETVSAKDLKANLDIYAFPMGKAYKGKESIRMAISNFMRGYPQYEMQAKTAANYDLIQGAKQFLHALQVDDIFVLDNQGYVVEAQVANFFVIKGDLIMTPPNDGSILPGITRATIASILQDRHLMFLMHQKTPVVVEKKITKADLYTADEIFLCGTYVEVMPVIEVDGRKVGTGNVGPYTKIIEAEYKILVRGKR